MKFRVLILLPILYIFNLPIYSQPDSQNKNFTAFQLDSLKANVLVDSAQSNRDKGNFKKAFEFLETAMTIRTELADSSGIANIYAVKSSVFQYQGNPEKAIEYLLEALKRHERINDHEGIALDCNFLAYIYKEQNDFAKAEEYFLRALAIFEKLEGRKAIENKADILSNLSQILLILKQPGKALEYGEKSAEINSILKNKKGIAQSFFSIGNVYLNLENYTLAEKNFLKSLNQIRNIDHPHPTLEASNYHQLSKVYLSQNQLSKAESFAKKAENTFVNLGANKRFTRHLSNYISNI